MATRRGLEAYMGFDSPVSHLSLIGEGCLKMVRPTLEYRTKENGGSIQFFRQGELGGSLSIRMLYQIASDQELKSTVAVLVRDHLIKRSGENGGLRHKPPLTA